MCGTLATYLRMCGRISDGIDPPEYVPDPAADVDRDESDVPRRFWHCHDCGRWFWKGSHWARVADRLADL